MNTDAFRAESLAVSSSTGLLKTSDTNSIVSASHVVSSETATLREAFKSISSCVPSCKSITLLTSVVIGVESPTRSTTSLPSGSLRKVRADGFSVGITTSLK